MNKNNIAMVAVICLAIHSGLFGLDISKKECVDTHKYSIKTAVANYMMTYLALYSAIPVVSVSAIKIAKGAPFKNSLQDFDGMNYGMRKGLLKTMPATMLFTAIYNSCNTLQRNISE